MKSTREKGRRGTGGGAEGRKGGGGGGGGQLLRRRLPGAGVGGLGLEKEKEESGGKEAAGTRGARPRSQSRSGWSAWRRGRISRAPASLGFV